MGRPGLTIMLLVAVALAASQTVGAQSATPTYTIEQASAHAGEVATVEGPVAEVFVSSRGNAFLDFGARYPNQEFSAVVFRKNARAFGDLTGLGGKRVKVTGRIAIYRGRPEIILSSPSQLRVEE